MIHRNNTFKLIIVLVLTFSGVFFLTKDSFASNPTIIGFIIEAKQMEGTMKNPVMITGDTAEQKDRPMLELMFDNLSAKDLIIKKLVETPKGLITIEITHKDSALFNNLSLHVTNAEFSEHYLPSAGNIGLKNVKLLTHRVTADNLSLPQFNLILNEGGKVEMEPKSEEELLYMKAVLEKLINSNLQQ
ncbi:hypothetical protein [Neobacillus vireti]|uniref:Uncharacterized protein n=1 Tax=Neobacillus vireti LMG 21834 TaxID=1131730 RepID=A0AB94IFZ5_9BACI|nr:hypothetical protein [Neobacillus vireti]ETI66033.1 hypothetical protein BAVI_24738 [Neobacillus vireti LMG 21834]KLT19317.1 hypothetical protein AA980_01580 [Neobacillus vireti]